MIRLEAALDSEGVLVEYSAAGHSGAGPKGADIVCAAVSALSRALIGALYGREGVRVRADAPERGRLKVELSYDCEAKPFLEGAGAVLLEGLVSVAKEYPEFCNLKITRE
ncbi:MAG: ribosomal-processing cysteine protease Prp [Spirochaetaceae bacterium]|jgi:uncharacterized protein YsxB (DUF464 family)|nr:ribosomal-processing cysteine protease Prp [Spirochaetaceae bacterium]